MINIVAVFLGGGIGAVVRYIITMFSTRFLGLAILGTFIANITGCFLIGLIFGIAIQKAETFSPALKMFLTVGFLGGLTTFSTFSNESVCLLKEGKLLYCGIYMMTSLILGLASTFLGYTITK